MDSLSHNDVDLSLLLSISYSFYCNDGLSLPLATPPPLSFHIFLPQMSLSLSNNRKQSNVLLSSGILACQKCQNKLPCCRVYSAGKVSLYIPPHAAANRPDNVRHRENVGSDNLPKQMNNVRSEKKFKTYGGGN